VATRTFPARVKAAEPGSTAAPGEFEAIVSVFGNVDSMGEVVRPGAFAQTLADWKDSGAPIPVFWSHRMDDPAFNIGSVLDAAELEPGDPRIPDWAPQAVKDGGGLWIRALLDTDTAAPVAAQVHRLLKQGRVRQFSFAYDVLDGAWETVDGADVYALRTLKLHEASVVQIGANDSTALLGVKTGTAEAAADRALAAYTKRLREAITLITACLSAELDDDEPAAADEPAKDEEPQGVKSEELSRVDASTVRLLCDLGAAEVHQLQ
jgi:uncharacterized protein